MEIVLIKQTDARLEEPAATHVRDFLFVHVDGATERDTKAWRQFIRAIYEAGSGEYFTITIKRQRNSQFHKLSMAVMTAVFKAQDRFESFDVFRSFVKLGAGHVDLVPGPDGEMRAVPKSVSFNECSEEEMREFHNNALLFFRSDACISVLWPDAHPKFSNRGMHEILERFEK